MAYEFGILFGMLRGKKLIHLREYPQVEPAY
jgi:hypothetical protein